MEYSLYPFTRNNKKRLYVRFYDHYDNEITRSTGVSYELKATKKQIRQARQKAIESAKQIVETYHTKHQAFTPEQTTGSARYPRDP